MENAYVILRVVSAQAIPADWTVLVVKVSLNGSSDDALADVLDGTVTDECLAGQLGGNGDVLVNRRRPYGTNTE
jgi:hypothetical protein